MNKILTWLKANIATILGVIQASLKALKELITGVVNALSIFMPVENAQAIVMKFRELINVVDGWVEQLKSWFLKNIE